MESTAVTRRSARDAGKGARGRRGLGLLAATLVLGGCASGGPRDAAPRADPAAALAGVLLPAATHAGARLGGGAPADGHAGPFRPFLAPVAVAARGSDLFVADAALDGVFLFDTTLFSMRRLGNLGARAGTRLHASGDGTLYVLDPAARELARYARDGRLLERFTDRSLLAGVGALAVEETTGRILLADRGQSRVLAVSRTLRAAVPLLVRPTQALALDSVWAIAAGPDALYVIDRSLSQIARLDFEGRLLQNFGAAILKQPAAIAVDRHRRVFVFDAADRTLRVFRGGELLATLGAAALGVPEIVDMAISDSELVVAGAGGTGIRVFRLLPPQGER